MAGEVDGDEAEPRTDHARFASIGGDMRMAS